VFPKTWKGFLESYPSCDGKKNGTWYNGGREGGNPKPTPETPKPTPYAPKPRPNNNGTQYTNPKVPEQFTGGSVQVNGWKTAVVGVVSVLGFFALS
jgi:hypothetical protein